MRAVFLCCIAQAPLPDLRHLPPERQARVRQALSKRKAKQLAYVWLLLRHALIRQGYDPKLLREVRRTEKGKPFFENNSLCFSLSHSGDYVACALSDEGGIGVDVQQRRSIPKRFFAPYFSAADLEKLTEENCCAAWSRKEAVLKAIGDGWTKENKTGLDTVGCALPGGLRLFGEWITQEYYLAVCATGESAPQTLTAEFGELYE